jgi:hypothetical protein
VVPAVVFYDGGRGEGDGGMKQDANTGSIYVQVGDLFRRRSAQLRPKRGHFAFLIIALFICAVMVITHLNGRYFLSPNERIFIYDKAVFCNMPGCARKCIVIAENSLDYHEFISAADFLNNFRAYSSAIARHWECGFWADYSAGHHAIKRDIKVIITRNNKGDWIGCFGVSHQNYREYSQLICGSASAIFDSWVEKQGLNAPIIAPLRFDLEIRNSQECSLHSDIKLIGFVRNIGLRIHDGGLPIVDNELGQPDTDYRHSEQNLHPMGKSQVKEGFRGLPIAFGWFALFMGGGLWIAHWNYGRQSFWGSLLAAAVMALVIGGLYFILLFENGFFASSRSQTSENASALLCSFCCPESERARCSFADEAHWRKGPLPSSTTEMLHEAGTDEERPRLLDCFASLAMTV